LQKVPNTESVNSLCRKSVLIPHRVIGAERNPFRKCTCIESLLVRPWMYVAISSRYPECNHPAMKDIGGLDNGMLLHSLQQQLRFRIGANAIRENMRTWCKNEGFEIAMELKVT
jgi:hypothetical protein